MMRCFRKIKILSPEKLIPEKEISRALAGSSSDPLVKAVEGMLVDTSNEALAAGLAAQDFPETRYWLGRYEGLVEFLYELRERTARTKYE